ncbi:MAG: hypothetical protein IPP10_05940 [Candidatus Competibacteraceae bacterium]|nr:hypothetical protein [Candidatus Competibacteraceae bacterium]MBK7983415.1 hypothetical protein [Candidatus Competibacteraceae bacterium]MBK9951062.1 hypothetical protein [Candidatus Competibacteraceae bacterium]
MKSATAHLYVALSGHGFGHLAQVAPVLDELQRRWPAVRLTVQSALPASVLSQRIAGPFDCVAGAADFGMVMVDALEAKIPESLEAYRDFHATWDPRLVRQEHLLRAAAPHGVLADIPYLTLAAAQRLGIPALALCSLNWADILAGYCPDAPDLTALRSPMLSAYNSASAFLQPAPSMPMLDLRNGQPVGPIAALGRDRRSDIDNRLGLRAGERLVLMGLGGVDMRPPLERWPRQPGIRWLVPPNWTVTRPDMVSWATLEGCSMVDLIRSCDVLFTKPGYGAFTEAACNGTRVLYVARDDWPEEPWLSRWLLAHGNAVKIDRRQLVSGELAEPLRALFDQPLKPPVPPGGIAEAVAWLERLLGLG